MVSIIPKFTNGELPLSQVKQVTKDCTANAGREAGALAPSFLSTFSPK